MSGCRVFQRNQPGEKPETATSVQCLEDSEKASMAGARVRRAVEERGSQTSGPGRPSQVLGCSVCGWGAPRGFEQGSSVCLNGTTLVAVYRKDCRGQDGNGEGKWEAVIQADFQARDGVALTGVGAEETWRVLRELGCILEGEPAGLLLN